MKKISKILKENIYVQLFIEFFTLGLFTFGGGNAMVATIQDRMEKRKWLEKDELLECIVLSQTLPGVIACNMASFVGYKIKGTKGQIVSMIAMIAPSFVIIILIASVLDYIDDNAYVSGALMGVRAAATGLIAFVALKLYRQVIAGFKRKDKIFGIIIMIMSFSVITFLDINAGWVILSDMVLGIVYFLLTKGKEEKDGEK